uniref:chitinase n=1 Tax=Hypocrella siamensis TaxID=696354 RepID=A0A0P0BUL1_9HYPO
MTDASRKKKSTKGCQSNCNLEPTPQGAKNSNGALEKVVAYYEGWSATRSCHTFPPSALPIQALTHVNLAFAYIQPETFKITPMDSSVPESVYLQTASVRGLKIQNPDLKVFVSIGGWTFSDNDTSTQPVFGDVAKSQANREAFASNLITFMREYGFDGVDLDWEYPGAPDRGGQEQDGEHYVELLTTLRRDFDASGQAYGLTFTAPSSYWYLRWFSIERMAAYADWINLMTYDLHGTWDSTDPIGSIIQAHTNLTEIKDAASLLWRNNVPPEKVVLGLGFYGRSFQLQNRDCTKPGCPFAGAATKGDCTDNGGTLAYFEIQDIISKQKPDVIWDKEDAVKYIVYGSDKDQWVSFDDKDTFQQKVKYANDTGLGGVMIWSIDQDTDDFTALEGLLGRSIPVTVDLEKKSIATAESWSSQNGQKCKMTECLNDSDKGSWGRGWAMAPNGDAFKDNCGKGKNKYVSNTLPLHRLCCKAYSPAFVPTRGGPLLTMDRSSAQMTRCRVLAHGEEVSLAAHVMVSATPTRSLCFTLSTGLAVVANLAGRLSAANRIHGSSSWALVASPTMRNVLAASQKFLGDTHLTTPVSGQEGNSVDSGTCWEIEMTTDDLGQSYSQCGAGWLNRKKVLCCKPPDGSITPFLPVELSKVFPDLPPAGDTPIFDIQSIQSYGGSREAFGWVLIDGPPSVVSSLSKRDGSHAEFLDCEPSRKQDMRTYIARYVCRSSDNTSNCHDVHLGGAPGTVVRLPEECGYATWGVVHDIYPARNQTVQGELMKRLPTHSEVYEIEFSYDFTRVKRGAGDVYVRIDYGDINDYWEKVVKAAPVNGNKRDVDGRLDKRFWSSISKAWNNKTLPGSGEYSLEISKEKFSSLIYQKDDSSSCNSGGWLSVSLAGTAQSSIRWGFSMVGTISPTLDFSEAYGFFDSKLLLDASLLVDGRGSLDMNGSTKLAPLFSSDISKFAFSHPGIVSFSPKMNVAVAMSGSGLFDGHSPIISGCRNFAVNFKAMTDGNVRVNSPGLGDLAGDMQEYTYNNAFSGHVSGSTSGSQGTILGVQVRPRSWIDVDVYDFGSSLAAGNIQFSAELPHQVRVNTNGGLLMVTDGSEKVVAEAFSVGISDWESRGGSAQLLGHNQSPAVLYSGSGDDPPDRRPPKWNGHSVLTGDYITCSSTKKLVCPMLGNMSIWDPDILIDPDTGSSYEKRSLFNTLNFSENELRDLHLRGTGSARTYTITTPSGTTFVITSHSYPNGQNGAYLILQNPDAGYHTLIDASDCENIEFTENGDPNLEKFVTEHIMELSYMAELLEFSLSGFSTRADGSVHIASAKPVDATFVDTNGYLQTPWNRWAANNPSTTTPLDDMWAAFGDINNPGRLVNAEAAFNGLKMRVWRGHAPFSEATIQDNSWLDTSESTGFNHATQFTGAIRNVIAVFEYLNSNTVNTNLADVHNSILDILQRFDGAVEALTSHTITMADFHVDLFRNVVIPRLESVELWVERQIQRLTAAWEQVQSQPMSSSRAAEVALILEALKQLKKRAEDSILFDLSRVRTS